MFNYNSKNLNPETGIALADLIEYWDDIKVDEPETIILTDKNHVFFQKHVFNAETIFVLPNAVGRINGAGAYFGGIMANKACMMTLWNNHGVNYAEANEATEVILNNTTMLKEFSAGHNVSSISMSYSGIEELTCKNPLVKFKCLNAAFARNGKEAVLSGKNIFCQMHFKNDFDHVIAYNCDTELYTIDEFNTEMDEIIDKMSGEATCINREDFEKEAYRVVNFIEKWIL